MLGEPWFYTYSYLVSGIACPFVAKSMSKLHANLTTTHPRFICSFSWIVQHFTKC